MSNAKDILLSRNLRFTQTRAAILGMFIREGKALSEPEIEEHLKVKCDRVTIYRTLTSFMEKGILHKVPDDTGVARYAMCAATCTEQVHNHNHVHFKCIICGAVSCIEQIALPLIVLPEGYTLEETSILMQGTCKFCNKHEFPINSN